MEYALLLPQSDPKADAVPVLILIVMEYALLPIRAVDQLQRERLNPYCNGICSATT